MFGEYSSGGLVAQQMDMACPKKTSSRALDLPTLEDISVDFATALSSNSDGLCPCVPCSQRLRGSHVHRYRFLAIHAICTSFSQTRPVRGLFPRNSNEQVGRTQDGEGASEPLAKEENWREHAEGKSRAQPVQALAGLHPLHRGAARRRRATRPITLGTGCKYMVCSAVALATLRVLSLPLTRLLGALGE